LLSKLKGLVVRNWHERPAFFVYETPGSGPGEHFEGDHGGEETGGEARSVPVMVQDEHQHKAELVHSIAPGKKDNQPFQPGPNPSSQKEQQRQRQNFDIAVVEYV
jgi:hypothetical protein